ncbi:hypothetical protein AAF712_001537 [Marasmius tenuissimus]|uniref:F-box domain-containing protein n=1 Tax=Marasmius tenuissimus TaxID=585030 RepID=A0ABR3ADX0_9AGAR
MTRQIELIGRFPEIRRIFRARTSQIKSVVAQLLQDIEQEMVNCDTEAIRLKTALDVALAAIEDKREKLKRKAKLYESLLSPIHALPSDVLAKIFAHSCEQNILAPFALPLALRISMVCSHWRDMSFSTPRVWSHMTIVFGLWKEKHRVLHEITDWCMNRSWPSPLRLSLTLPGDEFDEGFPRRHGVLAALKLLVENCERWKHISLSIRPPRFTLSIFDPIRGRLPPSNHLPF